MHWKIYFLKEEKLTAIFYMFFFFLEPMLSWPYIYRSLCCPDHIFIGLTKSTYYLTNARDHSDL